MISIRSAPSLPGYCPDNSKCHSTAECLVRGKITGAEAGAYCTEATQAAEVPQSRVDAERKRIFTDLLERRGTENLK